MYLYEMIVILFCLILFTLILFMNVLLSVVPCSVNITLLTYAIIKKVSIIIIKTETYKAVLAGCKNIILILHQNRSHLAVGDRYKDEMRGAVVYGS